MPRSSVSANSQLPESSIRPPLLLPLPRCVTLARNALAGLAASANDSYVDVNVLPYKPASLIVELAHAAAHPALIQSTLDAMSALFEAECRVPNPQRPLLYALVSALHAVSEGRPVPEKCTPTTRHSLPTSTTTAVFRIADNCTLPVQIRFCCSEVSPARSCTKCTMAQGKQISFTFPANGHRNRCDNQCPAYPSSNICPCAVHHDQSRTSKVECNCPEVQRCDQRLMQSSRSCGSRHGQSDSHFLSCSPLCIGLARLLSCCFQIPTDVIASVVSSIDTLSRSCSSSAFLDSAFHSAIVTVLTQSNLCDIAPYWNRVLAVIGRFATRSYHYSSSQSCCDSRAQCDPLPDASILPNFRHCDRTGRCQLQLSLSNLASLLAGLFLQCRSHPGHYDSQDVLNDVGEPALEFENNLADADPAIQATSMLPPCTNRTRSYIIAETRANDQQFPVIRKAHSASIDGTQRPYSRDTAKSLVAMSPTCSSSKNNAPGSDFPQVFGALSSIPAQSAKTVPVCAVGKTLDELIQWLPEDVTQVVLTARAADADPCPSEKRWIDDLMRIVLFYYTRERRPKIRIATLQHIRTALFQYPGLYEKQIISSVLDHVIHHRLKDPEPIEVIQADIELRVEAICELDLDENLVDTLVQHIASSAAGKRCGNDEILAGVNGLKSIIVRRLPFHPAYVPLKAVVSLYQSFLRSDLPPVARRSASRVLSMLSATRTGQIVIHPSYTPIVSRYSCRDGKSHASSWGEADVGFISAATSSGARVRDASVQPSRLGFRPVGMYIDGIGRRVGSQGGTTTPRMSDNPKVSPFLFVEQSKSADCVSPTCLSTARGETLSPRLQNSQDIRFLSVPEIISALLASISSETDHEAALYMLQALQHAVLDVSFSREVDYAAVGNFIHRLLLRTSGRTDEFCSSSLDDKDLSASVLGCSPVGSSVNDTTASGLSLERSKDKAEFIYAAGLTVACLALSAPEQDSLISELVQSSRHVLVARKRLPSNPQVEVALPDGTKESRSVLVIPDDNDFAALESLHLLLCVDKSAELAASVLKVITDSVQLGMAGIHPKIENRHTEVIIGDVWQRWRQLALCSFVLALERVDSVLRNELSDCLAEHARAGNLGAALMQEHCICFRKDVRATRRKLRERNDDFQFSVDAHPLPYLVSLRVTNPDEAIVFQRRATSSCATRMSIFHTANLVQQEPTFYNDSLQDGNSNCTAEGNQVTEDEAMNLMQVLGTGSANSSRFLAKDKSSLMYKIRMIDDVVVPSAHKVGVVYVGLGENKQQEILSHVSGGKEYLRFLRHLGTAVSTKRPNQCLCDEDTLYSRGSYIYTGDLKSEHDGDFVLVYQERGRHVAFHVATLIPDSADVVNRRIGHILNEKVLIVWNESGLRFDPGTFKTQCSEVLIVVSPTVVRDRFRVKVLCMKEKSFRFGPLQQDAEGYVLNWDNLPDLVRLTAIHANTMCHTKTCMGDEPVEISRAEQRAVLLRDLAKQHSQ